MCSRFLFRGYLALDDGAARDDAATAFFEVAVEPAALIVVPAWRRVVIHVRHHFLQVL